MPRHRLTSTIAVCLVLAIVPVSGVVGAAFHGNGQEPGGAAATPRRVVAVGDIHGAFDEFVALLQMTELIDSELNWSGGDAVLVQTGDMLDRGAGVRQVLDLMMRLQRQAPAAGGAVRVALANHEEMNVIGEVRDVTSEIMLAFATDDSVKTRDDAYKEFESRVLRDESLWGQYNRSQRSKVKSDWIAKHPLGYIEYMRAVGPGAEYGEWIRSLPLALIVDDVLFMHAGIAPELADWGVKRLNARVAAEIAAFDAYRQWLLGKKRITSFANLSELLQGAVRETRGLDWLEERRESVGNPPSLHSDLEAIGGERLRFQSLFYLNDWFLNAPQGPLWFRGYDRWDETEGTALAADLVAALGVRAVVVGHTVQRTGIRARFGGRVFLIDTGMLTEVYGGMATALEIVGDEYTAVRADGGRVSLESPPPLTPRPAGAVTRGR